MTTVGFDDFVWLRGRELRRVAYLLTGNLTDADDLVQAALVKVLARWATVERAGDPFPYVLTILVNTRRTWWRHGARTTAVADLPDRAGIDPYELADTKLALWQALMKLPDRQRKTVVLRYYEDLSEAETARILGCSVGTVKSQCAKGIANLRRTRDELRPSTAASPGDPHE
ncbi:MAG: hypothetical protein QOE24_966 [Frankiales bacterium]|jgi:RNA polymerase sigma-70 factor (sigma-E family)|nr:hypothetical protein [Frankiales bacterium]